MTRAINPLTIPKLPEDAIEWRRSLRRGSMFHAHTIGFPACKARLYLDRHKSTAPNNLADMQFWGVCPRCFKLGGNVAPKDYQ